MNVNNSYNHDFNIHVSELCVLNHGHSPTSANFVPYEIKKLKNHIFERHAKFFLPGLKEQRHEFGGSILGGDNTCVNAGV